MWVDERTDALSFYRWWTALFVVWGLNATINRKAIQGIFIHIFLSTSIWFASSRGFSSPHQQESDPRDLHLHLSLRHQCRKMVGYPSKWKKIIPPRQGLQRPEHLISVIRNQVLVLSRNHLPAVEHDIEGVQNIHRAWQRWNAQQVVQRLWNMATSWPRAFEIPHNVWLILLIQSDHGVKTTQNGRPDPQISHRCRIGAPFNQLQQCRTNGVTLIHEVAISSIKLLTQAKRKYTIRGICMTRYGISPKRVGGCGLKNWTAETAWNGTDQNNVSEFQCVKQVEVRVNKSNWNNQTWTWT